MKFGDWWDRKGGYVICILGVIMIMTLMLALIFPNLAKAAETDSSHPELGISIDLRMMRQGPSEALAWYDRELSASTGFFVSAVAMSDRYRNIYAGPYWKPLDWLQVGIGIGRESLPASFLRSAFFAIDSGRFHMFGVLESGSARWHRAHAMFDIVGPWSAGVMTERDLGTGPRIEYALSKKTSVSVISQTGRVVDVETEEKRRQTRVILGLSFSW